MTTTPTPAPTGFWAKFKILLPAIEMAGNVALLASGAGAPFEPLVAQLEQATNPLIQSLGNKTPLQQEIPLFYGTAIGVLTTLKQVPGLPTATLAEVDGYITAAQQGTAGYLQAQTGYSAANYGPVTPIA